MAVDFCFDSYIHYTFPRTENCRLTCCEILVGNPTQSGCNFFRGASSFEPVGGSFLASMWRITIRFASVRNKQLGWSLSLFSSSSSFFFSSPAKHSGGRERRGLRVHQGCLYWVLYPSSIFPRAFSVGALTQESQLTLSPL